MHDNVSNRESISSNLFEDLKVELCSFPHQKVLMACASSTGDYCKCFNLFFIQDCSIYELHYWRH